MKASAFRRSFVAAAVVASALSGCECGETLVDATPAMTVASELDFGNVVVGAHRDLSFEIYSTGRGALQLSTMEVSGSGAEAFEVRSWLLEGCADKPLGEPKGLLQQGQCASATIRFTPPIRGAFSPILTIVSDDPAGLRREIPITGAGIGPVARACAITDDADAGTSIVDATCTDPKLPDVAGSLDFGRIPIGSDLVRKLRVFNDGLSPLALATPVVTPSDAPFVVGQVGASIEPGAFADVEVTFQSRLHGAHTAVLRFDSNDEERPAISVKLDAFTTEPTLVACVLNADGTEDPAACTKLDVDPPEPPSLDFGLVPAFETRARTVRLRNAGDAPLAITRSELQTTNADLSLLERLTGTLEPGATLELALKFAPIAEGSRAGVLQLDSDDPRQPLTEIAIVAMAAGPHLCVDPIALDFGDVNFGTERALDLKVTNCGLVPWIVTGLPIVEADPSTLEFSMVTSPTLPLPLAAGAATTIRLKYKPIAQRIDTGTLTISGDRVSGTVALTGKGAPPTCAAAPSVANAGVDLTSRPLNSVTLDGRASSTPRGSALTYSWRLLSQPTNGAGSLSAATSARPVLTTPIAGDYRVELVVRDASNCPSAPDVVLVRAVPDARLHVLVTWPEATGDVDTHFIGPGGSFWNMQGDTFWLNKTPNWGLNNTVQADSTRANDPRLDVDQTWGHGPENLNQDGLFDGDFQVKVHYYCGSECPFFFCPRYTATPNVKIFVDGVEKYSATVAMSERDIFDAATVRVSAGGTRVDVIPTNGALHKSSTSQSCAF